MTPFRLLLANLKVRYHEFLSRADVRDLTHAEVKQRIVAFTPSPEAQARSIKRRFSRRIVEE